MWSSAPKTSADWNRWARDLARRQPRADAQIDRYLPNAVACWPGGYARQRLDRAPHLRLIVNVEEISFPYRLRRVLPAQYLRHAIAPVFAVSVSEMALGMAISAARRMVDGDAKCGGEGIA